jgi:quercetin dioxygenase-like cupin family protein
LLNPGDTFSFNSETPHRYVNPGTTMTYIHWVITPPIY